MATTLNPLVRFSGGEWSPAMDNRLDLEDYRAACRKLRNVIPTKQGGATRRPGSQFIASGKLNASGTAAVSSLRKFQFAPGTSYMLEFCDRGIRFYANGAQMVLPVAGLATWLMGTSYPAGSFVQTTGTGFGYYLYAGTNGAGTALINSTVTPSR